MYYTYILHKIPRKTAAMGMDTSSNDYAMDDSSGYGNSFKRRRFGAASENMDMNRSPSIVPFVISFISMPFGNDLASNRASGSSSWKRHQSDYSTIKPNPPAEKHVQQTTDRQTADIERITSEESAVVHLPNELKTTYEKIISENKMMKSSPSQSIVYHPTERKYSSNVATNSNTKADINDSAYPKDEDSYVDKDAEDPSVDPSHEEFKLENKRDESEVMDSNQAGEFCKQSVPHEEVLYLYCTYIRYIVFSSQFSLEYIWISKLLTK